MDFRCTETNVREAEAIIARYLRGREASAIMPHLWLAAEGSSIQNDSEG